MKTIGSAVGILRSTLVFLKMFVVLKRHGLISLIHFARSIEDLGSGFVSGLCFVSVYLTSIAGFFFFFCLQNKVK